MSKPKKAARKKPPKKKAPAKKKAAKKPTGRGPHAPPKKPGADNFFKGGKPNKTQLDQISALAECGVNQRTIADYLGIERKTFIRRVEDTPELRKLYRKGTAKAKEKLLTKAFERATDGKGDTVMLIFMMKALCGLTETGDREDEARERASSIRQMVDRMTAGLDRFKIGADGMVLDPKVTPPPPPKKKGVKSRVIRKSKG